MTLVNLFDAVSVLIATLSAVVAWQFVLLYRKEPWRSYEAGRHLMRFTAGLAIIMTWSVAGIILRVIFGVPDWLILVLGTGRIIIFGWLAFMLISRLRLLREHIAERDAFYEEQAPVEKEEDRA